MAEQSSIVWTARHRYLWTGRRDDRPVGTIEHGAHFTFIDVTGGEYHGFRTLQEAQVAAEQLSAQPAND